MSFGQMELSALWSQHKESFEKWLSHQPLKDTTKQRHIRILNRFFDRYEVSTFAELEEILMEEDYKRNTAQALRKFIKFLKLRKIISRDDYEDLKEIIKLKPSKPRKTRTPDEQIRIALGYYEQKDPILAKIYKTLVFSGLRLIHVIALFNDFKPNKLIFYENIAKYPLEEYSSGNKRVFFAYLPRDFAEQELERIELDYNKTKSRMRVKIRAIRNTDESIKFSASAVRDWFATFLARKGVPMEVINFIQGRAERGVLEKHYLNLEILADEAYSRVVDELKKILEK